MASSSWQDLLNKAETSDIGEELGPGPYQVEVTEAEYEVASTGRDMWKVTYTVTDGPSAGGKAWNRIVLVPENENALAMFFIKMKAMGIDKEFFGNLPADPTAANKAIAESLVGRKCGIVLGRQGGTGEYADRMEVKKITPPKEGQSLLTKPVSGGGTAGPKVAF